MGCSICGRDIGEQAFTGWKLGNNAEPVNSGRCCDPCNASVVIPERIRLMQEWPRQPSRSKATHGSEPEFSHPPVRR